jgi:hypothetical protein
MPSEDTDLNIRRQSFEVHEGAGVVLHLPLTRANRKRDTKGRPSLTRTLLLAMFVLGAAAAGLQWLTPTGLRSDEAATVAVSNPHPTGLVANSPSAVRQPAPNGALIDLADDPALVKGAGLERWWMDVQESVRPEE